MGEVFMTDRDEAWWDAQDILYEMRQSSCACRHLDMPGHCPGRANCPMCEEDEDE